MISRRSFLGGLTALLGGVALKEAIPFNRVWSFPSKIVIPELYDVVIETGPSYVSNRLLCADVICEEYLRMMEKNLRYQQFLRDREYDEEFAELMIRRVDVVPIRIPMTGIVPVRSVSRRDLELEYPSSNA